MKHYKDGWRFYVKMQQILMRISAAHGPAAWNVAATGPATENELVPGASTSGNPGDNDVSMADRVAAAEDFLQDIPPLRNPEPVASMSAPPKSSSGKCSHTDMVSDTAPPSVTSFTPISEPPHMSEAPRAHSDMKKARLSAQGGSNGG